MMEKELSKALKELAFESEEKEKRAAALVAANRELAYQNEEKERRAAELIVANIELAFQNEEKEKRAGELLIANKELIFQNNEKDKRAAELVIANRELEFQNGEKGKRAAELAIANAELAYQNEEKGKRAAELVIANTELAFQNKDKEKRAAELATAYKELELLNFISSHDLQEPLRKIQMFVSRIMDEEGKNLSDKGKEYLHRVQASTHHVRALIMDLLAFSQVGREERAFENYGIDKIVSEATEKLKGIMEEKAATIDVLGHCEIKMIPFQFRQLFQNLISNSLKFSNPNVQPHIVIESKVATSDDVVNNKLYTHTKYCHITIIDNGIGFDAKFSERIFELFQRLHSKDEFPGTGIGLAIVKKIVDNHKGTIKATSVLGRGTAFDIFIPVDQYSN